MKFKPRSLVNPMVREKNPVQRVDKWNPPAKENILPISKARIEPNAVSSVTPDVIEKRKTRFRG
jgi:hypothetical protein